MSFFHKLQGVKTMSNNDVYIKIHVIEKFIIDVFKGLGVPEEDAIICDDVIIAAHKTGIFSHVINRLKPI